MPRKPKAVCSRPGCDQLTTGGACATHKAQAERARGSATQRGYGGRTWSAARKAVLTRDPTCTCVESAHAHTTPCGQPSTVADHYPRERKALLAAGVTDPDAPHRLRGVCARCHNRKTATSTPGGWNT